MIRERAILSLFLIYALQSYSQASFNKPIFCSPGISFGYTFGAKLNYGFSFDIGFIEKRKQFNNKIGFSFYQYFVYTKKHMHRLRSVSLMYQNEYLDIKIGRGRAKNPWGFTNRNKCVVHGFTLDVSASYPSIYSPWIGYRLFKFNRANWAWFMTPYNSIYIKYKFDVIQNTNLKNTITGESKI